MAVAFWKLEDQFARKFAGKQLKDRNDRWNGVPIFLDYPDIEDSPEARFPSISIVFSGMSPDTQMYDSDMERQVSVDYSTSPPTFVMRRMAEYYDISYEVTCYSLSAAEDRELTRWVESRFLPRDYISVDNQDFHVFRTSLSVADSVDLNTVIYEKSWTFTIKADIEDTDNDSYQKGLNEVKIHSNIVKTQPKLIEPTATTPAQRIYNAPQSATSAEDAEKTLHRVVAFDDQKYWFPNK